MFIRVGEITQGRILVLLRSPLSEPEFGYCCFYLFVQDVGEIHRRVNFLTLVLPPVNRKNCDFERGAFLCILGFSIYQGLLVRYIIT